MDAPSEILHFYATGNEFTRLSRGIGPLEHQRTWEILLKHVPETPAFIADVGGAHGVYAFWLAALGHQVHLLDLSPDHIKAAQNLADAEGVPALVSIQVGDARALPFAHASMDMVLLQGPLYHLMDQNDRHQVLTEAFRVLKTGGKVLACGITHTASLMVGIHREWLWDLDYFEMVQQEVTTGLHHKPESWPNLFMDAFFHHPEHMKAELEQAGFQVQEMLGIEGPAWAISDFETGWSDGARRARILETARLVAKDPILSPHFVAVGIKP